MTGPPTRSAAGLLCGVGAFTWWGLAPLYFKEVRSVSSPEILAHRILWSVVFLALILAVIGRLGEVRRALQPLREKLPVYALTTALISMNWLLFIWAVNNDRLLEASLGYFINPLVNVVLGVLVLRESLNRRQVFAVGLAAVGVAILVVSAGVFPWVSLTLAGSFAAYGLARKRAGMDPLIGLLIETSFVAPIALAGLSWLEAAGEASFGHGAAISLMLLAAGPVTSVPLILFTEAVRRLPLSTVGLLQYLAPTGQFLLALWFGEPFTRAHVITFACIWVSLAIYTADALWTYRRAALAGSR